MAEETVDPPVQQDPPKSAKLYNNLLKDGYTKENLGNYNEFHEALQNPIKANKIYSGLRSDGYTEDNLGTIKEFQTGFVTPKKPTPSGGPNTFDLSGNGLNTFQNSQASINTPIIDPHERAIETARQQRELAHQQQKITPAQPTGDMSIMDNISQALYVPAIKQGFNDVIIKPLAGATDFVDRTIDKTYKGITGQETPSWMRESDNSLFKTVSNQIQKEYDTRDKPTNIVSEVTEGAIGTLPLIASMYTGTGEAGLAAKAPQLFGRLSKVLATTKGLSAYHDATKDGEGYGNSLVKSADAAVTGGLEGGLMEAQMLVGGALGKGVVNKLAEKGLLKGGKTVQAVIHALSVGTTFGGTAAGEDLLSGKDIDTRNVIKQFGMGLAFEAIPTIQALHGDLTNHLEGKKINSNAAQAAVVANSASNMNGESALRTLINTPVETLKQVHSDIPDNHETLYANSIEKGAAAYDAKSVEEKRDLYAQQLALKAQGDIKLIADKVSDPETFNSLRRDIGDNQELSDNEVKDLHDKLDILANKRVDETPTLAETPKTEATNQIPIDNQPITNEQPIDESAKTKATEPTEPNQEFPAEQQAGETIPAEETINKNDETTKNSPIKSTTDESTNQKISTESGTKETGSKENAIPAKEEIVNSGEAKAEPDNLSHADIERQSIENETDPKKIAARYHTETSAPDYIEKGIIDYLGNDKINEKDYQRITGQKAPSNISRWIDVKNGDTTGLDVHADILSHELGVPVTEQDIVETIDRYSGRKNFEETNKTDTQKLLESKYLELTGKTLTARRAENAFGKMKKLSEDEAKTFNATAKEIGITEQDVDNYEQYRKATEPATGTGDGGNAKSAKDKVSKSKNDKIGRKEENKSDKVVQGNGGNTSLSEAESKRLVELRKKFSGVFNDITNIPVMLANKEFREYAGLVFKDTVGDFKAFSKRMVAEVGEKIKEHLPGLFKELGGELPDDIGEVKKKVLTRRAYEGGVSDDVKRHLEEKGLIRQSFSQEERSKQATEFINKFGDEAAYEAVKSGDVEGGMAASILAQLQIKNSRAMDKLIEGTDEREILAKKQADIISLMEKKAYSGGDFNGQLGYEYQDEELNFANVKKQIEKLTGRKLSTDQEVKVKRLTAENEKLRNRVKEAEAKLIDETDKEFSVDKPEPPVKPKTEYAKKALDAIVKVRAKIKANSYSDATGMVALVDTALGTIEAGIRTGMTVSKAIERGIEHIKTELKKRGINTWEKEDDFRKDVTDAFAGEGVADSTAEQEVAKKEQANIKRLEKELDNARQDRLKESPTKRESSAEEDNLKEQIKTEKLRIGRENMQRQFLDKSDNKFTHSEAKGIWDYMKGQYLDKGETYKDAMSKAAQDLGLSWRQVSEAITTPKNKRVSDEMYQRQRELMRNTNAVKNWVSEQNKSDAYKLLKKVSGTVRGIQVFGHGHVFIGTHAGMTLFNPRTTATTIKAFFNGWKLAYGKEANYERAMEELKNSPNYVIAQRAGLKNNPDQIHGEEYQKNQHYLGRLGTVGERGFNAIKVLRQNLFDHEYAKLSPAEKADPEVAKSIAQLMNLATGATSLKIPEAVNEITFAGGMEAARWQKLLGSPAKAANTAYNALIHPEKATVSDRVFAKIWARRVGQQLATYTTAMLVNAAIQNTINPKNPVNLTDPDKPDFFKFKFGDTTIDPTSGMRSTAAFIYKLGKVGFQDEKELRGEKRSTVAGKDITKYSMGKLAPLYGTLSDVFNRHDFNNNLVPWSDEKPASYAHKLTWPEYALSKTMLPVAEAANVTYQSAFEHGANKVTLDHVIKGVMIGALSGATGFRVGEFDASAAANNTKENKALEKVKYGDKEYKLNDEQVNYRKSLNEQYLKTYGKQDKKDFTIDAYDDKGVLKKLKEQEKIWKDKDVSAEEKKKFKQGLIDEYVQKKMNTTANKESNDAVYDKYKDILKEVEE